MPNEIQTRKNDLRAELKERREKLNNKTELSQLIIKKCIDIIHWDKIRTLHSYVASEKSGEVDTWALLNYAWDNHPKIDVYMPVVRGGNIQSAKIDSSTEWRTNPWGFLEPVEPKPVSRDQRFDVIIVPALGFDRNGYRIGHGSGHYDKFLAGQVRANKIGLAFSILETKNLPVEPHDMLLDTIITDQETLTRQP